MTSDELVELVKEGETSRVQFKIEMDEDKIATEIIALANTKGGVILLGVHDKTGEIAGLNFEQLQKYNNRIAAIASDKVKPQIFIVTEVVSVKKDSENLKILVISVEEGVNKPYKDTSGIIWVKQGSDKRKLTDNAAIARLLQQGKELFADEMEIDGTGINDLNEWLFNAYFKKEFGQTYAELGLSYEQALTVKRTLKNGQATLAGLMFFGNEPQNFRPVFTIKTVSYFGNDIAGNNYRNKPNDLVGTIPELFKQAMMFLTASLFHVQKDPDFNSKGELEISKIALEELVQNALLHRDYFKSSPIRIIIFDNRVEIISPGSLPNTLTVEEAKFGNPVTRNHQLVKFATHTLPYSGLGSGLKRALKEQPNIELINDEKSGLFVAVIPRLSPPSVVSV
ncbi:MAG: putative DNA binding domain-containing protein [Fibromonadales bacterium]|nr:putative DNA binding domain-containing protein [Fibromonadales bacterium]